MRRRRGFTLLEVMIVVFLLSLLSASVTISSARAIRDSRRESVVERMAALDREVRERRREYGRDGQIIIDLDRETFAGGAESSDDLAEPYYPLPSDYDIESIRVHRKGRAQEDLRRAGRVALEVTPRGISPTYAVTIRGPEKAFCLLFSGLTGSGVILDEAREIDLLFGALARRHAD